MKTARLFESWTATSYVSWALLLVSVLIMSILMPVSLTDKGLTIESSGQNYPTFEFHQNITENLASFAKMCQAANRTIRIVISLPTDFVTPPSLWTESLTNAVSRGVSVKVYTNAVNFTVPSGVSIKFFAISKISFRINYAVFDEAQIEFPSSFFAAKGNESAIAYAAYLTDSQSSAQDLLALFDFLWSLPSSGIPRVTKKAWIGGIGFEVNHSSHVSFPFHSGYSLSRSNLTSQIQLILDDTGEDKIVFSPQYFPAKPSSRLIAMKVAYLASLLEIPIYNRQSMNIVTETSHFNNRLEMFRSLSCSMKDKELESCNMSIDGTIIASEDNIVVYPGEYYHPFLDESIVLGLSYNKRISFSDLTSIASDLQASGVCQYIPIPSIYVNS